LKTAGASHFDDPTARRAVSINTSLLEDLRLAEARSQPGNGHLVGAHHHTKSRPAIAR